MRAVPRRAFEQIGRGIVRGHQPIGAHDAAVEQCGHGRGHFAARQGVDAFQVGERQRRAHGQVHTTLGREQSGEDALQIFVRRFRVGASAAGHHFARFEQIAGFPFVAHRRRHDVQRRQSPGGRTLATECEHLDQSRVGGVDAVLGAPVALGDPHRRVGGFDHLPHVARQPTRGSVELTRGTAALHAKHLVRPPHIDHQRVGHEVGAEGDFGRGQAELK